ncbi:putative beta-D-xylosidase [Malania oleifera]|uniref:putative beta-D-xylosidase n=1 Tax=Malania oleifera TaxID=397392 RepID=UPI0025AE7B70|nr:putative beta-D-xylosidase [Malania oleifera]
MPLSHYSSNSSFFFVFFFFFFIFLFSCGDARGPFACDPANGLTRSLGFCRVNLSIQQRVRDLIARLTLQEKILLLVDNAAAVPRLGIQSYEWWSEALHGVSDLGPGVKFGGAFPGATSFPQVITTAASFNASLWRQIGQVVSDEARAMYNGGTAGLTYWSPNVNVLRDPRWGRAQETPGEDPAVVARYAVNYVKGLQSMAGGNRLKVAACCKHYTAYDLDNWKGVDRYHFNALVSEQDLEETFNVPFKACVMEGQVASVMCSYNQVNGRPTCADPNFRNIVRGQWHLNGYIVSDCDSVERLYNDQHYTKTPEDAAAQSIRAGLDLNCGTFLALHTAGAVQKGKLSEADVNWALTNTLTVQMRLGMFDGDPAAHAFGNLGPRDVCTQAHQSLALEAAHQGIVLLQNRGNSLPLSTSRHRIVAVIGPNSDATLTMIGNYHGAPCLFTSPLQGISKYAKTIHQLGCLDGVACNNNQLFARAEVAARRADATILVMGLDQSIEAEYLDRAGLLLPGLQQELILRAAQASKGPTILVLMSGGPVDISFAKNDPRIAAIVWAGYPGQAGGQAIADVLFGTANPGGKLPMTWYPNRYLSKVPMTNMALRSNPLTGYPGRTYRFYNGPVVFPFGFGLSYTKFVNTMVEAPTTVSVPVSSLHALKNSTQWSNTIRVTHTNCDKLSLGVHVDVQNIGSIDGPHTILLFSKSPKGKRAPIKQLVGFEKVHVVAGSRERVKIAVDVCKHLTVVDEDGIRRIPMGKHTLHLDDLKHSISLQASLDGERIKP